MNTNQSETPATTLIMDVLDENGDIEMNSINVEAVDAVDLPKLTKETDIRKEVIQSLVYKVSDRPPIHLAIFFALQQALLSLSGSLAISLLVADVVCAANDEDVKSRLLSSTLFMNGVTTLAMVVIGVRLPLYLGAAGDYIIPLLVLVNIQKDRCNLQGEQQSANPMNMTDQNNASNGAIIVDAERASTEMILNYIRMLEGSLILAGVIQFFIGVTGLTGLLLRYLGPVTIFTAMLLNGIYIVKACLKFIQAQWGIALLTCGVAVILSVYLEHKKTPLPFWTRDKGLHIKFYPFHQVFAILIAITVGWLVCALLTYFNVFSPSKDALDYLARTDARSQIIHDAKWFSVPYPGQFGSPSFDISVFIGFLIATFMCILDSIGDYIACARVCRVPPPPAHAANRGIAVEGLMSALSGAIGCGHATTTYGGNIGAIGITKVASRSVFVFVGIIYILFGIIGKFSAVFITIPYPVLGGALITMFGMYNGVVLSNLQTLSLKSSRNLAILGISLFMGLAVPLYVETNPNWIDTGAKHVDGVLTMILANPALGGMALAFILDNTVHGTTLERGVSSLKIQEDNSGPDATEPTKNDYLEGLEVYLPLLPKQILNLKILKYIPFLPQPSLIHEKEWL
ncbi:hypothetical protein CHS0354_006356 [Potamilus streckersoni]|uniref:Solute carrier family 23 member 2 n=1 Tax=Potamilus streckersoni TaxID=2493646 RepID=A0AAE0W254_9BIVA|nr:hypothetical protein CHS0354_006356 [Potamilus streckersoni]